MHSKPKTYFDATAKEKSIDLNDSDEELRRGKRSVWTKINHEEPS
jgi:hypothetical protein